MVCTTITITGTEPLTITAIRAELAPHKDQPDRNLYGVFLSVTITGGNINTIGSMGIIWGTHTIPQVEAVTSGVFNFYGLLPIGTHQICAAISE